MLSIKFVILKPWICALRCVLAITLSLSKLSVINWNLNSSYLLPVRFKQLAWATARMSYLLTPALYNERYLFGCSTHSEIMYHNKKTIISFILQIKKFPLQKDFSDDFLVYFNSDSSLICLSHLTASLKFVCSKGFVISWILTKRDYVDFLAFIEQAISLYATELGYIRLYVIMNRLYYQADNDGVPLRLNSLSLVQQSRLFDFIIIWLLEHKSVFQALCALLLYLAHTSTRIPDRISLVAGFRSFLEWICWDQARK